MVLLKEEATLKARYYKVKASVDTKEEWKTLTPVLHTGEYQNIPKENCLPRAWARLAIAMKPTRLQSAAYTQLNVKQVIRLEAQLGKIIVNTSLIIVTDLAPTWS